MIDNKTLGKENSKMYHESLIKFGQSNNLSERVKCHKKNFMNFRLVAAFKVKNKIQIENAIKKHPILSKRIRSIKVENANYEEENYRELLALDNENFTIEKIDEHIRQVIKETEYNIENYNLLLNKNYNLEETVKILEKDNKLKDEQIKKLNTELEKYTTDITVYTKDKIASNYSVCKNGYYLYAFECENMKYKCSITRQKDFEQLISNLKQIDKDGEMKYYVKVLYPFSEKIMMFLLKQSLTNHGNTKFQGTFEIVKQILDITVKLEKVIIDNYDKLDKLSDILDCKYIKPENVESHPEIPQVRKVKHSIDQLHPVTNELIKTHESFEAAGRAIGLTTGTAIGTAVRNRMSGGGGFCKGFIWRYSGISKEDQYSEQPVIKICCSNGEQTHFDTIADASRDCGISAPGMRTRILTSVHANGYHWIFNKNATHYNQI